MSQNRTKHPIYIVEDEKGLLHSLFITLSSAGYNRIETFDSGRKVLDLLPSLDCRVMLLDLFMPGVSGEEVLDSLRENCPHVQVVVVTGINDTDTAVRCIKKGAFDYLVKPVEPDRLVTTVRRALSHSLLMSQNEQLKEKLLSGKVDNPDNFQEIITSDRTMHSLFSYVEVIAPASDPVLITGETGTGKDLMARALHKCSGRQGDFVSLDSSGLDDSVFADTLFGHARGAFTDARKSRKGLVEKAAGGTLFLDEIGDMTPASQLKLLKLAQDRQYYPLGSDQPRSSRARIVAATNRDLEQEMEAGNFRRDLFYRINTYHISLPPLRKRFKDIIPLTRYFVRQACADLGMASQPLTDSLSKYLPAYEFPGNIRELRSLVYGAMATGGMEMLEKKLKHLTGQLKIQGKGSNFPEPAHDLVYPDPLPSIDEAVTSLVFQALERTGGNQAKAARMLGISRQALNKRLKKINPSSAKS
ncbi:MAG: sigma-54-dependent transcriptional regulator [Desulfonatronovibrionaceae bacterium]